MKKKNIYGEKKYYSDYKDNRYVKTIMFKEEVIKNDYKYVPNRFVRFFSGLFYYLFAYPILWIMLKIKYGVKVKGKSNLKGLKGAVLIGNHTCVMDGCFASVFVAFPKRNYIITKKDAVSVVVAKHFTKALGVLPLPDQNRGLVNLSQAIDFYLNKGKTVSIFPEACIWPYYNKLRPLPPANFHYAVKSNKPVVPFCITYRYKKGKNYLAKKPNVNITILEPIYPDTTLTPSEAKLQLASETERVMRAVINRDDNVGLYQYIKEENTEVK